MKIGLKKISHQATRWWSYELLCLHGTGLWWTNGWMDRWRSSKADSNQDL